MGYRSPNKAILSVGCYETSMNDSANYYFGNMFGSVASVSEAGVKIPIGVQGRISCVILQFYVATVGSAENVVVSVRLNLATDYLVTDTLVLNAAAVQISNVQLNIPVVIGNIIEIKMATPAWVTNPLLVRCTGQVIIECE